jgi:hypothetical protein
MKDFYTANELATEWHCSIRRIWNLNKLGMLHGIKVGRGYIYTQSAVMTCLDRYQDYDLGNIEKMKIAKQLETKKEHLVRMTVSAQ